MAQNITTTTTLDSINHAVAYARQQLADTDWSEITGMQALALSQNLISTEAVAHAQATYLNVLKNTEEMPEYDKLVRRAQYLSSLMSRGADDGYSGRRNDSARSTFDAVRSWASQQLDEIFFNARMKR